MRVSVGHLNKQKCKLSRFSPFMSTSAYLHVTLQKVLIHIFYFVVFYTHIYIYTHLGVLKEES